LNREIEQQVFAASIIKNAETSLKEGRGGLEVMGKLNAIVTEQGKNVKNDAEREKLLSLKADLSQITARFISQAEFIAQPSIPSRAERPTPAMYMALLGFLFAVLAMVYSWRIELLQLMRDKNTLISNVSIV
jgi:hypothetical protein